jgi:hypothetical protein
MEAKAQLEYTTNTVQIMYNCSFTVFPTSIALMMEAVCTSETSVNFNVTTRLYIPKDSKLQFKIHLKRTEVNDLHL